MRASAPAARTTPRSLAGGVAPRVVAVGTALPVHRVDQRSAKAFAAALFGPSLGSQAARLLEIFDHSGIETRAVCMPVDWYARPRGFAERNALYVEHALELAAAAAGTALGRARCRPRDVDHVLFVSSTGVATPSLDAHLANRLGFREDVRRTPIWGLGCAGGAAGLSRARDLARAEPGTRVLLVAVELCSLTFQPGDRDRRNLVAAALFSDGAAAAVVEGAPSPGGGAPRGDRDGSASPPVALELHASRSILWPASLDVMGWTVDDGGFHVVFSRDIPALVRSRVRAGLQRLLEPFGLSPERLDHVITHPGGPKVLAAFAEAMGLPERAFRHAREVLRTCGNMSSPTCLFVLERALASGDLVPGGVGVVSALGPGFGAEHVLFRLAEHHR